MNLFRSEDHARRWPAFQARAEEGFITLPALAGLFGTESRRHMLDADYLSTWYPRRAAERRAYLEEIGKTSPSWLGTPDPQGDNHGAERPRRRSVLTIPLSVLARAVK